MKRIFKIYTPFINAGMQETATYRVNWVFYILGSVLGCFVSYFIWHAVFLSGSGETMNGFSLPQMIVYIFLIFLTSTMIGSDAAWAVGEEVRDGSIAMRLIKPVSYNATFLFQELGNKLLTEMFLVVPLIAGLEIVRTVIVGRVEFSVVNLLIYLCSCVLAYLIKFFFNICFGFLAFVIKYLWGANMMKNCIVGFLSGAIIPLSFLPETLGRIFMLLPFASLNYTPVMIYMGVYQGTELLYYIGLQVFWALFFFGLSKLLWVVSVRRLSVQGG